MLRCSSVALCILHSAAGLVARKRAQWIPRWAAEDARSDLGSAQDPQIKNKPAQPSTPLCSADCPALGGSRRLPFGSGRGGTSCLVLESVSLETWLHKHNTYAQSYNKEKAGNHPCKLGMVEG